MFKEIINYIINHYKYNMKKSVRRDFITRTLIILCEKYDLNNNPKFITFEEFKKELEFTISIMTGNINITVIDEIVNSIISLENEEKNNEKFNSDNNKVESEDENDIYSYEV